MIKNLLLAVLTVTTIYLGWMAVPGLRPINNAHAAAFTTTKTGEVYSALAYRNCTGLKAGDTDGEKIKTKSGNEDLNYYAAENACPRQGQVIRAIALQTKVDNGDEYLTIAIDCCDAYIQNVQH